MCVRLVPGKGWGDEGADLGALDGSVDKVGELGVRNLPRRAARQELRAGVAAA